MKSAVNHFDVIDIHRTNISPTSCRIHILSECMWCFYQDRPCSKPWNKSQQI